MPPPGKGLLAQLRGSQLYRSIFRHEHRGDERERVLRISSNLFLHVHPTKVRRHGLALRFTWGMGGIAFLLFLVLVVTGVALMFHYRPTVEHAPADVRALASGSRVLRNLHRFGSHALVIATWLHLLRVFLTGSYKPPREFNWVVGVVLLVLTMAMAFTGHLLPWDRASVGAVAAFSGMAGAAPPDGGTLLQFYVLHSVLLPLGAGVLCAVHFWRVRKDGGISGPP